MPPFVSRKRERSPSPISTQPRKQRATPRKIKKSVFEDADALGNVTTSAEHAKKFFDGNEDERDSDSSHDDDSDELEFEDVPDPDKRKSQPSYTGTSNDGDDSDDEQMEWEDATGGNSSHTNHQQLEIGDLSISVNDDGTYIEPLVSAATGKKGPSKRERQARIQTHCLHVQTLLWHNTVRNSWLNDSEVQRILVDGLTDGVKKEIKRWRQSMGMSSRKELDDRKLQAAAKNHRGRRGGQKVKAKESGRDWSYRAQHTEQGAPDLSHGDPLLRLLKVLAAYWRKRFTITAPGLRKQGYMSLRQLKNEIKGWSNNRHDAEQYGERIESRAEFWKLAKACEGSRDVGAQLFVALLRGLGLETRMVANLQPAGIGWSKYEEASPKTQKTSGDLARRDKVDENAEDLRMSNPKDAPISVTRRRHQTLSKQSTKGSKFTEPIRLDDDSESPLSSAPSDLENGEDRSNEQDNDDLSVIDLDPPIPRKPNKKHDRDLAFPVYWAEVMSPISNKYIPVDPIVLSTIASNEELLQTFEPRGKKAELVKQVICYAIAFNADGSAKDVTIRYLKKHQMPGKTKGVRMGAEKIPIYNRKGKVKRYEEYDWFRTVMSMYDRPVAKRVVADDVEDQSDLKAFKANKEEKVAEKESLQWYKQSAEFVLEQHLRREEAIRPGAKAIKTFTAGKGDKAKDHPVYLREDVLQCKTVESWHKEGRELKLGEQPVKTVPMRAVTITRKREMEEAERETGEKLKQGLYSTEQTDWIIPPPIEDGKIPKNAFGNIDVYVRTMVPQGAVHLPLKGSAKLCKRLGIDFAEACTGFEFGKQRAVPVLTGVVVAKENERLVRDAWRTEQEEVKRKENVKRVETALRWWRKMVMGLRILDRMEKEYEDRDGDEERNPFVRSIDIGISRSAADQAGGFLMPGNEKVPAFEDELLPAHVDVESTDIEDSRGGFLVEDGAEHESDDRQAPPPGENLHSIEHDSVKNLSLFTPISLQTNGLSGEESSFNDGFRASSVSTQGLSSKSRDVPPAKMNHHRPASSVAEQTIPKRRTTRQIISKNDPTAPKAKAKTKSPARGLRSGGRKVPSVKSRYFSNSESDEQLDLDSESAQEVTKPRATTRRTRRMKA